MCSVVIYIDMIIYNGQECVMMSSFTAEGGGLGHHHHALFLIILACMYSTCHFSQSHKEEMSLVSGYTAWAYWVKYKNASD